MTRVLDTLEDYMNDRRDEFNDFIEDITDIEMPVGDVMGEVFEGVVAADNLSDRLTDPITDAMGIDDLDYEIVRNGNCEVCLMVSGEMAIASGVSITVPEAPVWYYREPDCRPEPPPPPGATLTTAVPKLGLAILCDTVIIEGRLTMMGKAYHDGVTDTSSILVNTALILPENGGNGGAAVGHHGHGAAMLTIYGNDGSAGIQSSGGGASGGILAYDSTAPVAPFNFSGSGTSGKIFGGGKGGEGFTYNYMASEPDSWNMTTNFAGEAFSLGGGLLIVVALNKIEITSGGRIDSNGVNGWGIMNLAYPGHAGLDGGSGGGIVSLHTMNFANSGQVTANGGLNGMGTTFIAHGYGNQTSQGGKGGDGAVIIEDI